MNPEEFRKYGKQMIDYIVDYHTNIRDRDVAPTLDPGYLKPLIPGKHETLLIFYSFSIYKSKTFINCIINIK